MSQAFVRELKCAGKMSELPVLIEFVETSCSDAGISPDLCFDLTLALEEAASNVIEHGYKGSGGELGIVFRVTGGDVTLELRDRARPFKPGKVGRPDESVPLEDRPLGGLGLHLMHQLMDEVYYETLPNGNRLTMIKRGVA
ncbi:MAG: ATP-binding protein [Nitrososphaerales archaeon]